MTNLHATYLNETQLAERWGISKKMLQKLRYQGGGPQFLKIGHLVRYSIANIESYETEHQFANTTQMGGANHG